MMILMLTITNWIQITLIEAHGNQGKENVTTRNLIFKISRNFNN